MAYLYTEFNPDGMLLGKRYRIDFEHTSEGGRVIQVGSFCDEFEGLFLKDHRKGIAGSGFLCANFALQGAIDCSSITRISAP